MAQSARWDRDRLLLALLLFATAAAYGYRLGEAPLAASEAYSALAAAQPSIAQVAHSALSLDPGKPVLYHLLLHWFCGVFGTGELALRSFSVIFGLLAVYLVFALGQDQFGFAVGWCAAAIWGFSPVAAVLARWARMYSMFIALALGHVLAMVKARRDPRLRTQGAAGVLGGAMLYTHFGAVLILAADAVVILRDLRRTRRAPGWPAVVLAVLLFLPFTPIMVSQSRALLFGHWLDWLGASASHGPGMVDLSLAGAAAAILVWLVFAAADGGAARERLQQCLIYGLLPMLALAAGSFVVRPMFEVRYVSPSFAILAIVIADLLDRAGARIRNLATAGCAALFAALLPLCYSAPRDPWPAIAARVAAGGQVGEPIFFESGFFSPDRLLRPESAAKADSAGFTQGFFRVPFDYYFHAANPRAVIPLARPSAAQAIIETRVKNSGGAWLISANRWSDAIAELPRGPHLEIDYAARFARISVFHVRWSDRANEAAGATR